MNGVRALTVIDCFALSITIVDRVLRSFVCDGSLSKHSSELFYLACL